MCSKHFDSSHLFYCRHFCHLSIFPEMAGICQRTLKLRMALRFHRTPTVAARLSPVDLYSSFLPSSSWQFGSYTRKLHTVADGPKLSPAVAPDRLPFSRVTQEDLAFFSNVLPGRTITDPDLLQSSNVDWLKSVKGDF